MLLYMLSPHSPIGKALKDVEVLSLQDIKTKAKSERLHCPQLSNTLPVLSLEPLTLT